ncbi:MAG: hypothetical protein HOM11_03385 [Methylococcales bacterium]|jgi:hypothetical protein|nr:hypothetical protein [Methylococcales bacterium]MBT7442886.1 hypothetical protein [Methylococcales bacterium]
MNQAAHQWETPSQVDQAVETLCAHGCSQVHVFIAQMQKGVILDEVANLSANDRRSVLATLIDVMATYKACRNPNLV